jgi:8-oxo-dGTP pyrophosphatase MutT (NUDIX family)/stage V sporulation protein SpoVS
VQPPFFADVKNKRERTKMKIELHRTASIFLVYQTSPKTALVPTYDVLLLSHPKYQGRYMAPGGHIEAGELQLGAAFRELEEETGLNVRDYLVPFEYADDAAFLPRPCASMCYKTSTSVKGTPRARIDEDQIFIVEADARVRNTRIKDGIWVDSVTAVHSLDLFESIEMHLRMIPHYLQEQKSYWANLLNAHKQVKEDKNNIVRVVSTSSVESTAVLISSKLRLKKSCEVHAVGASSVARAVETINKAGGMLKRDRLNLTMATRALATPPGGESTMVFDVTLVR